jgi:hypothetical protein
MLHVAEPCGCQRDIGMTKAREPHHCEHGNLYRYAKALGRSGDSSRSEGQNSGQGSQRRRRSTLKRGCGFAASKAQRNKVKGLVCLGCGREGSEDGSFVIDPAHLWPKGKGGCDKADCVIPLCRFVYDGSGCHQLFDEGKLDLLSRLEERDFHEAYAKEIAHPIAEHGVSLVALVRRLTGSDWEFRWVESPAIEGAVG